MAFDGVIESWGSTRHIPRSMPNLHSPSKQGRRSSSFLITLLKFIFWHSSGTGVLSHQKSMHLSPLFAQDELRVYEIDQIFALITLGYSAGFYEFIWLCTCSLGNISNARWSMSSKNRRVAQKFACIDCTIEKILKWQNLRTNGSIYLLFSGWVPFIHVVNVMRCDCTVN